ncbi:MAG TPA: iron chelate uptake ABC transporter family permease subunit [Anaerolineaceae bacterium]|nr:iron chelate uptake ABC transporter family permease subunit [Anaerolineaceae bacterium]
MTTKLMIALLLAASVAITAVVVSVAGIVGWIGLIIPHIARRIAGANAASFIPVSMSLGAVFGIICDDLARVLTTGEVPLGIITSLIGAVIFLIMMTSRSMRIAR